MRFIKRGALAALGSLLAIGVIAGCGVADSVVTETKAQAYEGYRVALMDTATSLGFTNVTAVIEDETDKATATTAKPIKPGKTNPSATPKKSTAPAAQKTVKVIELLANIPNTKCRVNIEQTLEPGIGKPYVTEIVLPNNTEVDIPADMRPNFTVPAVFNYAHGITECAIPGVSVPTVVFPSASGMTGMGASPAATP